MPRASKSRVVVEIEAEPSKWVLFKGGFRRIPDAEQWVEENIPEGVTMRVSKISGIFRRQAVITKR